jgi:hypothetical protein
MPNFIWIASNSKEHNPSWKAYSHSASQEILCLLWNPKVHHCVQKSSPLDTILSQVNHLHALTPSLFTIHLSSSLPSTPRSSKWFFPSGFPTKILYAFSVPRSLIALIMFGEQYKSVRNKVCGNIPHPSHPSHRPQPHDSHIPKITAATL